MEIYLENIWGKKQMAVVTMPGFEMINSVNSNIHEEFTYLCEVISIILMVLISNSSKK